MILQGSALVAHLFWLRWIPFLSLGAVALITCLWSGMAWRAARAVVEDQQAVVARYRAVADHQPTIEAAIKAYSSFLATSPSEDAAVQQLLAAVEQAARQAGVQITKLTPRPATRSSQAIHYTVEMECAASIQALAQFLFALEYGPIMLRTERLRIDPATAPPLLESHLRIIYTNIL